MLWDSQAIFKGGFTFNIRRCSSTEAELWGVLKVHEYTWNQGHHRVQLETDCVMAMEMIKNRDDAHGNARNLVEECNKWIEKSWEVTLGHTKREFNWVADRMSNEALTHDRCCI